MNHASNLRRMAEKLVSDGFIGMNGPHVEELRAAAKYIDDMSVHVSRMAGEIQSMRRRLDGALVIDYGDDIWRAGDELR